MNISTNRRQDPRISAPSTGVRIRKRGLGFHRWNTSTLVNVSASGIAVSSSNLRLNTLNKVDFELSLEGKKVSGSAIVCHITDNGPNKKYGLLFIQANTEISQLRNTPLFSSDQAKRLGEDFAERFLHQRDVNTENNELKKHHQLMLDAVKSMTTRLGEMGLKIKDENGVVLAPHHAINTSSNRDLSFPALTSSNEIARFSVSTIKAENNANGGYLYQLSSGDQIQNLSDLLDYICTCFDQIAVPA